MHIYLHVYIYIYMHIFMYIYIYVYTHMYYGTQMKEKLTSWLEIVSIQDAHTHNTCAMSFKWHKSFSPVHTHIIRVPCLLLDSTNTSPSRRVEKSSPRQVWRQHSSPTPRKLRHADLAYIIWLTSHMAYMTHGLHHTWPKWHMAHTTHGPYHILSW